MELAGNYPDNMLRNLTSGEPLAAVRKFLGIYSRPSLTWEDLSFLRDLTDLPIVLKGITHPEDARLAVEHGMDGLVVSNHGGRQVDAAVGSIEMLPAIADAVDGKLEILFDSGIRTGADAFKAIALGAKAVLLGRPYVYALAIAGEEGVVELLRNFKADFDLTMGLCGYRNPREITRDALIARDSGWFWRRSSSSQGG
jgi:lactate 2-monooxygenase